VEPIWWFNIHFIHQKQSRQMLMYYEFYLVSVCQDGEHRCKLASIDASQHDDRTSGTQVCSSYFDQGVLFISNRFSFDQECFAQYIHPPVVPDISRMDRSCRVQFLLTVLLNHRKATRKHDLFEYKISSLNFLKLCDLFTHVFSLLANYFELSSYGASHQR
jgi:hypothetical protein